MLFAASLKTYYSRRKIQRLDYQDFCAYYSQQCEQDARWYAENSVEDYYSRIEAYLGTY